MVAGQFIDYLTKFQVGNYVGVEDFADKFNFLFTVIVLLICTSVVTVKQYILKPISCYLATDIGGFNLLEYVENYCWVEGTIPISREGKFPSTSEEWNELNKYKILYYQWIPFLLSLQAIMFYIPRLIWQIFCYNITGTDIHHLIVSANQAVHSSEEARTKMVNYIAKTMEQMLFQHRDNRNGRIARFRRFIYRICSLCIMSKRQGTRLLCMYFIIKLLYLANCAFQLCIMKRFLGLDDAGIFFGFEIMKNIRNGQDWKSTLVFPRVGYCYVNNILNMGSGNSAVAQCVLPVNMLNEKIFFFLWCWIFLSAILLTISIIMWLIRTKLYQRRRGVVYRFLKLNQQLKNCDEEKCMVVKFEQQFLRYDGVFLLRMISLNAGDIVAADIVCQLWKIFKSQYANRNFLSDGSDDDENHGRTLIRLDNNHTKPSFEKSNSLQSSIPSAPKSSLDIENSNKKNFRKNISSES